MKWHLCRIFCLQIFIGYFKGGHTIGISRDEQQGVVQANSTLLPQANTGRPPHNNSPKETKIFPTIDVVLQNDT